MSKFVTGEALEKAITDTIFYAKRDLIIVSPFIKLDAYFKKLFDHHLLNPKVALTIVFGKNEGNVSKSIKRDDLEYFTKFPNVTLVYVPNLHAKYYANEEQGVITSINLYDYSFKNNIEYGVFSEVNVLGQLSSIIKESVDNTAYHFSRNLAEENKVIFSKRPQYEKKMFGLTKDYTGSQVLFDTIDDLIRGRTSTTKKLSDFPSELESGASASNIKPTREQVEEKKPDQAEYGFCIRTGKKMKFDPKKPFTYDAYLSWAEYENYDYPEKYCHKTGVRSDGRTSMRRPILNTR